MKYLDRATAQSWRVGRGWSRFEEKVRNSSFGVPEGLQGQLW